MCGICGKIYLDPARTVDSRDIRRMTDVLHHRGPDDSGLFCEGRVGLGHRRLSIIDLSDAGHQPMTNEDRSLWLVYNGEIYNYKELRRNLLTRGHRFSSDTDSEVILHLYEEEGTGCVQHLRGMFAFALWDAREQQLFITRDRAGKKPLVYAEAGGAFLFASEIKALLQDPAVDTGINKEALHHYLTYQYVPGPHTIFKGIYKLPPAHTLVLKNGTPVLNRYWSLSYRTEKRTGSLNACIEEFNGLFDEAVRLRLRSDVPLGAFLSGGIDSSATVAVMSKLMNRPVKTFSIGFDEADFNELSYARRIAELFKTEHTEFVVRPRALDVLPKLLWHYDEPYADPSSIPTYYVSRMTREHVKVALNGDGGDESFAGYERYVAARLADYYCRIPSFVRNGMLRPLAEQLPHQDYRWSVIRRLKRFITGAEDEPARCYVEWLCYFNSTRKKSLYTDSFLDAVGSIDSGDVLAREYDRAETDSLLERLLHSDVMLYLPYDLLVKVDIASMAHSLEARSPFLDHTVMEFAAALPPSMKLHGMQTKYFLKKAFENVLPRDILHRRKMGFGVPLNRWFRAELHQATRDILLARRAVERGYFRESAVRQLIDEHAALKADHSYRLWALLYLELWHRMFVDKSETLGL